ncbi:hypothetical protein GE061_016866 [Apolygus lucorum]|uniref:Malate dehydrogenase, mitochondrial n=1 Tax=Apolygus lucorum TaxID=248454 RepID=A0A8S9XH84_APOLU|nr:hypothetical protein GE061_016866 [Apolygus lucorum]
MHPAYSATRKQITVIGINSLFGKAVSFLLKQSPIANRLVLYDECNTEMAYDISEINTTCKVVVYNGEDQLGCAVKNSDLILIGDKEDPGPNFDETISKFAPDVIKYAEAISCSAPNAIVLVATSPVNSMMTLFSEVQRRNGTFNCDRVMGVTSVDTMRASTVLARHLNLDPEKVHLPVIGGSSPDTRIPLFSQSRPAITVCKADLRKMTRLVKMSECELLKLLKRGDALNKAFATVRLMTSVMSALGGQRNISEIVLSRTCMVPDVDYFSLPVILGPRGISHRFPIPTLTPRENILLDHAIKFIQVDKQKAVDILCSNSKFPKTPEKTKEYSDLLECDKKGLFVGALLDRLRIRKEACKPKLEYLLMCKNDAVYPPESQPSMTPKRMKFVEPDIALNDGCCPVKLPFPPSPPKRGLNAIAPKISNCKFESSPCPYPPVVKLPTTCHVCDKGTPCERFEDCKSLYGDAKCCTELPQPNCKSLLGSKSEQSVTKFTSSADHQQVASQQTSNFERAPVSLQCEQPKCNSANFSVPYTGIDTVELNSVLETPATVYPPKNVISENNCPYGLNTSSPTLGLDQTSPTKIRPKEDFTQNNQRDFTGTAENVHQLESVRDSSQQKCSRLDSDRLSKLQSSSASAQSQAFQNPKTLLNQEVVTHGTHLATESVQPRETMGVKNQTEHSRHDLVDRPKLLSNPPYTQSKDSGNQNQNFTSNQGTVTYSEMNINGQKKSTDRSLNTPRRTLDQSIDHCLSKICFVEINTAKVKSPLAENDMRIATAEASKVASSGIPGVSDVANDQSVGQLTATVEAPKSLSGVQHSSQYNSTVSPKLESTNTSGYVSVKNTSKIQTALPENDRDPAETLHRNSPSTTSAVYNYSGGLGIPSKPKKKDSKMPFLYFNPWSAKREEQYYNKNSGTNAQLKNRLDREQVGEVPNENRSGKSGATGYLEHPDVPSSENAYNGDTSARKTSEQGAEGTDSRITSSILGTKLLNSFESTRNKTGTKRKDILETSPLSSETEKKIIWGCTAERPRN